MIWHSVVGSHFPTFMGWRRENMEGEEDSCRELSVSLISAFRTAKLAMCCGAIFGKKKKLVWSPLSIPPSITSPALLFRSHNTEELPFFFLFLCDDFSQSGAITRIRRLMRSRHISQSVGGKSNIHAENFQKKAFSTITALISADFKIAQYLVKTSCNGNETCSINKKDCPS